MKALENELVETLKREWSGDQTEDTEEEHEHERDQHKEGGGSGGGAQGEEDTIEEHKHENEHNRDKEVAAEAGKVAVAGDEPEDKEDPNEGGDFLELIGDEELEDDWIMSKDDKSYNSDLVQVFYDFIQSTLYPRTRPDKMLRAPSKCDDSIKQFIAVYSLQPDGNFRQAVQVTRVFTMFHYHIRGAIFYEGYSKIDDFGGNLYKYAFPTFLDLPVSLTHVYCTEWCFIKHCKTSSQAPSLLTSYVGITSVLPAQLR